MIHVSGCIGEKFNKSKFQLIMHEFNKIFRFSLFDIISINIQRLIHRFFLFDFSITQKPLTHYVLIMLNTYQTH